MIEQGWETGVSVSLNGTPIPAVTGVNLQFKRNVDNFVHVQTNEKQLRITIQRYLPMTVSVGEYSGQSDFSVTVADAWHTYCFTGCNWLDIERNADKNGVTETLVILANNVTVS